MKTRLTKAFALGLLSLCFTANAALSQGLALPYTTGFDTPADQAGWQQYRTGFQSLSDWNFAGNGFSLPHALYHGYNVGGAATDTVVDWMVSPGLNFTTPGIMSLKIRSNGFSPPSPNNLEVWFGTLDPDPVTGNFVQIANLSYIAPDNVWIDTTINIPFMTPNGYIAFKYTTIGAAWRTYAIDDIDISSPLSIGHDERKPGAALNVYPNPFTTQTTLRFAELTEYQFQLYDAVSRQVLSFDSNGSEAITLERGDLKKGIYFLRLVRGNETVAVTPVVVVD